MSFLDSVQSGFSSVGDSIKNTYNSAKYKLSGNSSPMVSMPVGGKYRSRKHKKGGKSRKCKKGGKKYRSKRRH